MQLICGMHRSGTSLVARLLHQAGADFGDPAGFYPADQWNEDGYFEQTDILATNIALVNGPWWKLSYLWLPSRQTIMRRAQKRAATVRSLAEKYRHCVVKENRFCLTLDAWLRLGAEISKVLIVFREPRDVAFSLRRRNRIPLALAYRLWCRHYERLLAASKRTERRFLHFDRLLEEPSLMELNPALAFLGLPATAAQALGGPPLRRRAAGGAEPAAYPAAVRRMYDRLIGLGEENRAATHG